MQMELTSFSLMIEQMENYLIDRGIGEEEEHFRLCATWYVQRVPI